MVWKIHKSYEGIGYKQSQGNHTLFIKHLGKEGVTELLVYVDDIILNGNYEKEERIETWTSPRIWTER